MVATLGGVDALAFTAGVGEHVAAIWQRVCENLSYLGLILDRTVNNVCQPDADIALPTSTGRILVIATSEDVTIVRKTWRVLTRL
jgi:acetate kinase